MFNIDFRKVFYNLLPWFKRSAASLAWVYSFAKPLKDLNIIFNAFRDNTLYNLRFTSQTIYLEHFLNDQFDPIGRGIFITNLDELDFVFLFNLIEAKPPFYMYQLAEAQPPIYFKQQAELINETNFIINIPVAVTYVESVLRARVDFYNQAGKNYTIVTY